MDLLLSRHAYIGTAKVLKVFRSWKLKLGQSNQTPKILLAVHEAHQMHFPSAAATHSSVQSLQQQKKFVFGF